MNSSLNNEKRVKIFVNWNVPNIDLDEGRVKRAKSKSSQALRAQDLIRQSLMLVCNITQFLIKKESYHNQIDKSKEQMAQLLDNLFQICNSDSQNSNAHQDLQQKFNNILCDFYIQLRTTKNMEKQIQNYFQGVNLTNYDKKTIKIQFTKNYQKSHVQLLEKIKRIKENIDKVQKSLMTYQQKINLNKIFGKEDDFQYCLTELTKEMNHENIIQIHFLMLYQLDKVDEMLINLNKNNRLNEMEFSKYQAIYNCLCMMKNQKEEMILEKQQLEDSLKLLNVQNSHSNQQFVDHQQEFVIKNNEKAQQLDNNLKIYQSNQQNFIRVNAETNIFLYFKRRTEYTNQLSQFEYYYSNWKSNKAKTNFLYEKHMSFEQLKKQIDLQKNNNVSEKDKKNIVYLYNEVLQYQVKQKDGIISSYKEDLLNQMQKYFSLKKIFISKRIYQPQTRQKFLARQIDFFKSIKDKPEAQKISMIQENLKLIQTLNYQANVHKQNNHDSQLIKIYHASMRYCQLISQKKQLKQKLNNFNEIFRQQGIYQAFPNGFAEVFFNYVVDISIAQSSQQNIAQIRSQLENQFVPNVKIQFNQQVNNKNFDKIIEKHMLKNKLNLFELYDEKLRNISVYDEKLFFQQLNKYLNEINIKIFKCLQHYPQKLDKWNIEIEKKQFYTFRILSQLTILSKNDKYIKSLKIRNIEDVLDYIFSYLDRHFTILSIENKLLELLKLTLFENYLREVFTKGLKITNYQLSVKLVKKICLLNMFADYYSKMARQSATPQKYLQPLLQIQLKLNSSYPVFNPQSNKSFLDDKCASLSKQLKKYPLTIAAKHNIVGFINIFKYENIIYDLRALCKANHEDIIFISKVYVLVQQLKDIRRTIEIKYQPYQNIIIKSNKSCHKYFQTVKNQKASKIMRIDKEIQNIQKIFLKIDQKKPLLLAVKELCQKSN